MCEHCEDNKGICEDLKDVKGYYKIFKELGDKEYEDLNGKVFNKLRAVKPVGRNKHGSVLWLCECECFTNRIVSEYDLKRNRVRSCGSVTCRSLFDNLEGRVFTRWTVIKDEGRNKVFCKCSCGTERWVDRGNLRGGGSTNCGCEQRKRLSRRMKKDLTGQVFGRLTVLHESGRDKHGKVLWHVRCSCGNEFDTTSGELLKGNVRSCGCLRRDMTIERCTKPMIGKTFGRLTVIDFSHKGKGGNYYKCRCSCNNIVIVKGTDIRSGNTRSCGCLLKDITANRRKDLTGQRFGKLQVLSMCPPVVGEDTRFVCQCDCGSIVEVLGYSLQIGETMSCGCLNSKGEFKVSNVLLENNIEFVKQKSYPDLRSSKFGILRFDFYIPEGNYLIEYDGQQHFKAGSGWDTEDHFEKVKRNDKIKNEYCKRNGITLIRIPYTHYDNICIEDLVPETSKFVVNS